MAYKINDELYNWLVEEFGKLPYSAINRWAKLLEAAEKIEEQEQVAL
jgi:hypothetical protein